MYRHANIREHTLNWLQTISHGSHFVFISGMHAVIVADPVYMYAATQLQTTYVVSKSGHKFTSKCFPGSVVL